jgi:hypothetical protein
MNLSPTFEVDVHRSIIKHFNARKGDLHMFVEGFERTTADKAEWFELRVDGPEITDYHIKAGKIETNVNVFLHCVRSGNAYRSKELLSQVRAIFTNNICVINGDDNYIGGLVRSKTISVDYFGQSTQSNSIDRYMLEATYHMYLGG